MRVQPVRGAESQKPWRQTRGEWNGAELVQKEKGAKMPPPSMNHEPWATTMTMTMTITTMAAIHP
jgi:hypothetical protein